MSTAKPSTSVFIAITGTSEEAAFAIDTNDGVSLLIASIHLDTDDTDTDDGDGDDDIDDIDDSTCHLMVTMLCYDYAHVDDDVDSLTKIATR